MMTVAIWLLTSLLMLVGVIGVIVPMLPGTALILIAAVVHWFLRPEDVGGWTLGVLAVLWIVSVIADFAGVMIGAKKFGGSKWGMAGAGGGALIGMFFSLPALILGTIFGAVAAEKVMAKKTGRESLMAGVGAATGFVLSTVARLACAVAMIGVFVAGALM